MKKLTLLFAMLITMVSSAWAEMVEHAIDRSGWTVTAYANPTGKIEGAADGRQEAMLDGSVTTFFHSAWDLKPANQSGDDATQAFLIDMAGVETITKITLLPRDNGAGAPLTWRIYVYGNDVTPVDLTSLTTGNVQSSLSEATLGTPTLSGTWADNASLKTATFATPVTGRYILFVADDRHRTNAKWLCVAEFNAFHMVDEAAAAKADLSQAISKASTLPTGTGFGTYDATKMSSAIAAAQAVYENISTTKAEAENAIVALNAALLAADNTPGNWTMKTSGRTGNNYLGYSGNLKGTASAAYAADAITFDATEIAGQYLIHIGDNYFTNCTQSTQVGVTTDKNNAKAYQVAKNSDGTYGVQSTDGGAYQWFHLAGDLSLVGWTQDAGASKWVLEGIKQYATITYQIKDGEQVIWQKDIVAAIGEAYPVPSVNPWVVVSGVPSGNVTVAQTVVLEYTSKVKTFANVADIDQWYSMDIHGNENNYQLYNSEGSVRAVNNGSATDYQSGKAWPDYAWAFIGNPFTGVKVYNNGAQKFLSQPSDADVEVVFSEEGNVFQVLPTTATQTALKDAFALKVEGRNYYINHRNPKVQGWTDPDAGSAFRVFAVEGIKTYDHTELNNAIAKAQSYVIGTGVGQYQGLTPGELSAGILVAQSFLESTDQTEIDAATAALNNALAKLTLNMPVDGHYYTLQGVVGDNTHDNKQYMIGATVSVQKGDSFVQRLVLSAEPEGYNNVFQYVDGKLLSVTANCYVVNNAGFLNLGAADAEGVAIEFTPSTAVGTYLVKFKNGNTDRCTWSRFEGYIDGADYYADREVGYQWNIVESDYVPAANMKITAAQWGTFWAPFAVEIPEGVKAYTGEMKGDWIKMTEVESVIPANTGVVVTSEQLVDVDLKPAESDADALESCYTGNTTGAVMNVEQGAYLLQKNFIVEKGEEVVGWYKVDGEGFTLAPNRCYLAKGKVAESRTFIGFEPVDGDATGISTIASQAATKADGKYMVKGQIVVVKSGKAYNVNGTQIK